MREDKRVYSVALDGPSGAGKSTMAKLIASELGFLYVDTGAIYRTVGLYVLRRGVDPTDAAAVTALLPSIAVELRHGEDGLQHMLLCGEDVTDEIRRHEVSRYASDVSAIPEVRAFLLDMQRDLAARHNVVMDGRDIGTVVLPNADVKIFLTADLDDRAARRCEELRQRGHGAEFGTVRADIAARDQNDSSRAAAPLRPAKDAVFVDTTGYQTEQSRERLLQVIKDRLAPPPGRNWFYTFLVTVLCPFFYLFHPFRVIVQGELPLRGAIVCPNHYSPSDPFFVAFALRKKHQFRIMAKAEVMRVPILGWLLRKAGVFGVERGKSDIKAIKEAMRCLKNGEKLLMFPEGTRNTHGEGDAKTGVAMLALRTGVPVVPVWMRPRKHWFWPQTPVVIGAPYYPHIEGEKATPEDYRRIADDLMNRIFALEELSK